MAKAIKNSTPIATMTTMIDGGDYTDAEDNDDYDYNNDDYDDINSPTTTIDEPRRNEARRDETR